jgi:DNA ligase (NAD+)
VTCSPRRGEAGPGTVLREQERQASSNAVRLLANLGEAKSRPLWRIIVALSIRHVGPSAAQPLAAHFGIGGRWTPPRPGDRRRGRGSGHLAEALREWFAVDWHRIVDKWRAAYVELA